MPGMNPRIPTARKTTPNSSVSVCSMDRSFMEPPAVDVVSPARRDGTPPAGTWSTFVQLPDVVRLKRAILGNGCLVELAATTLIEHGEEDGCVNLTSFNEVVAGLELDEDA